MSGLKTHSATAVPERGPQAPRHRPRHDAPAETIRGDTEARAKAAGGRRAAVTMLVWAPALAGSESTQTLRDWAEDFQRATHGPDTQAVLVLNGPGSRQMSVELRAKVQGQVGVLAAEGRGSIGRAQQMVTHLFLGSDADLLARVDADGQFPPSALVDLRRAYIRSGTDAVIGQRDAPSVSGPLRFLANVVLRCLAHRRGVAADPNSGAYVLNRRAAAALCQVPLNRYPEPRMLIALKKAGMSIGSCVVPTLPRRAGRSTLRGARRAAMVFFTSALELMS